MADVKISENVKYIGVDDRDIDLFESQYIVPNGVSYNSYLIIDEKIAVMDTVDSRKSKEWLENLEKELAGKNPDYLIISHLEPDHSGTVLELAKKYPEITLVGNAKTFAMGESYFDLSCYKKEIVKEGDILELGQHSLQFIMAPMVHWPEVMVEYEQKEKILFSADGFGKFGALDTDEDWACEARRYYFNIVGKYGAQVQALLKKAAGLEIETICPLHGPILQENLEYYIGKYDTWSKYEPEDKGVFIAYASIHGNTAKAAEYIAKELKAAGEEKVAIADLSREDIAECVEDAFRYDRIILAASSYDGGVFLPMEDFLTHLKSKTYQNRKVAIIENGSWAPCAARKIKESLEAMKNITIIEPVVTIKARVKDDDKIKLKELASIVKEA